MHVLLCHSSHPHSIHWSQRESQFITSHKEFRLQITRKYWNDYIYVYPLRIYTRQKGHSGHQIWDAWDHRWREARQNGRAWLSFGVVGLHVLTPLKKITVWKWVMHGRAVRVCDGTKAIIRPILYIRDPPKENQEKLGSCERAWKGRKNGPGVENQVCKSLEEGVKKPEGDLHGCLWENRRERGVERDSESGALGPDGTGPWGSDYMGLVS